MLRKNKLSNRINREFQSFFRFLPRIILSMVAGALLILFSWIKFGGPCRVTVFFRIPGGGITIAAYYILWFIIFALCGGETALICSIKKRYGDKTLLLHIATHLCMFLWYPLFFTTLSQFLALLVLSAALILLILELKEIMCYSLVLSLSFTIKIIILSIFVYINIAFLLIN